MTIDGPAFCDLVPRGGEFRRPTRAAYRESNGALAQSISKPSGVRRQPPALAAIARADDNVIPTRPLAGPGPAYLSKSIPTTYMPVIIEREDQAANPRMSMNVRSSLPRKARRIRLCW
jgi:hypothetical protein